MCFCYSIKFIPRLARQLNYIMIMQTLAVIQIFYRLSPFDYAKLVIMYKTIYSLNKKFNMEVLG